VSRYCRGQATVALLLVGLVALVVFGFLLATVVGLDILPPAFG